MDTTDRKLPASFSLDGHQRQRAHLENAVSFDSAQTGNEGDADDLIHIVVKRTGGTEAPCLELSIEKNATVLNLKTLIQDELADESPCLMVPVDRQRLLYAGQMLTDDQMKLLDDLKMKPGSVNFIHLAPRPKDVSPSPRTSLENKSQSRRRSNRTWRSHQPYRLPSSSTTRRSLPDTMYRGFMRHSSPIPSLDCSTGLDNQSFVNTMSPQSIFPSLEAMLSTQSHVLNEAIVNDTNDLLPLCRVIRSNISHVLGTGDVIATEQSILLLDQLSQRSASLSQSLRTALREQRHRQLLSAQLENRMPWGAF